MDNSKKIKSCTLTISVILLTVCTLYAQTESVDILYLKNGSILRGNIIEMVPNQTIKIRMADGSLFVYKMEEVEKVIKEPKEEKKNLDTIKPLPDRKNVDTIKFVPKAHGFFLNIQFCGGFDTKNVGSYAFSSTISAGYQTLSILKFGLGFGIITSNYSGWISNKPYSTRFNTIPIFIRLNALFLKKKLSPMINTDFGLAYNFSSSNPNSPSYETELTKSNGGYFDFGVGMLIYIRKSTNITVSLDYINIGGKVTTNFDQEIKDMGSLIMVKLGIGF